MKDHRAPATMAPEKDVPSSYANKDELYYEDKCRGAGDPDYYGYPGEDSQEGVKTSGFIEQKPF